MRVRARYGPSVFTRVKGTALKHMITCLFSTCLGI
ncbi:Uncharacterized protein LW94_11372 [Fusarium fujikuroi]|nr:Uncharacterized protein LW93_1004 [Fusarium fujikuroi]KLP08316.1 Uncharacterized protein Y057_12970 [Fusarium fujikuroi]KLP13346.1 Uncharacterized protein LW94_11372 [Fusarium fujikuroi]